MKRILPLAIIFIQSIQLLSGQAMGTIRVNENYSATCEFDSPVKSIYIANNDLVETITSSQGTQQRIQRLYDYIIDGCIVVFSSYKPLDSKSVTIKLSDGATWYGILSYDPNDQHIYYPFRDSLKIRTAKDEQLDSLSKIKTRLSHCLSEKSSFRSLGITKNRVYWEVSNIMTDQQIMYVKIRVSNKSGHVYQISNQRALFTYEEGKSRNLKKKEASVKVDALIVHQQAVGKINAYSDEILGYAITSYPLNRDGNLVIDFLEAGGKRNYELKIPFKYLEKVETFND